MNSPELVLSNKPLEESEDTVTLDILGPKEIVRGSELAEKKAREGKITLNPKAFRIFSIPAMESAVSQARIPYDRTQWDLYLVTMLFTLHDPMPDTYYQEVTFLVTLTDQDALAYDLFPQKVFSKREETKTYTLSPDLKFKEAEISLGQLQKTIRFESIQPIIRAFGVGENTFYWMHTGFAEQKAVTPETKNVLAILQVPHGTRTIDGMIRYQVTLAKKRLGRWRSRDCHTDSYPIHWDLSNTPPFFESTDSVRTSTAEPVREPARRANQSNQGRYDVCIICALAEEAEAAIQEISQLCGATFRSALSPRTGRAYRHTTISNRQGQPLTILVSWPPDPGPVEIGLHLKPILEEFHPHFAIMTGICAADRRKAQLGDIIVAERAFPYDTGKFVTGNSGQAEHLYDTHTQNLHPDILQVIRMFDAWKSTTTGLLRPVSLHQQRDWLLTQLLNEKTPHIEDISEQRLKQFAPTWRRIVHELQNGPQPYLSAARALIDKSRVAELRLGREAFPFKDAIEPTLHIAAMASGSAVRADNPFDEIQLPVRGTIAIDMEGAAFYRTVADFSDIRSLLVKGVCDYADASKDDSYHHYASCVSARYALAFIQEYIIADQSSR